MIDHLRKLRISVIETEAGWLPESFGSPEAEYAALRKRVGIFPAGHRARLDLEGKDTLDLLQRLCAQQLNSLEAGDVIRAPFLDGKGNILADCLIGRLPQDRWWIDTWADDLSALANLIERSHFSEDCRWQSADAVCFGLLGPAAHPLLQAALPEASTAEPLGQMRCEAWNNHLCARADAGNHTRLWFWMPAADAPAWFTRLCKLTGWSPETPDEASQPTSAQLRGRPVGWEAFNTARVEDHDVAYHIDFGPDNVPAEAGPAYFDAAISTDKGCYPGQEAVLRMHNLGHPKKLLVKLKVQGDHPPLAGTPILLADPEACRTAPRGGVIGAITSSCLSPLAGATPIAIGMIKWGKHTVGTDVRVAIPSDEHAGGGFAMATVVE